jgi:rfaE bifunctional protein kinase chain/domain
MQGLTPPDLPALLTLCPWIESFAKARIVVWGDVVADRFVYGSSTRISREAPALVVRREREEIRPGGAGNAMMNTAALGAQVTAVGFLGGDDASRELRTAFGAAGIDTTYLVERNDALTPMKTRIMAGGRHTVRQQILRIDADRGWPVSDTFDQRIREALASSLSDADALLISDYGMGNVAAETVSEITKPLRDRGVVVVADSRNALMNYRGVNVVAPNEEEVEAALDIPAGALGNELDNAGRRLITELECEAALITRGSRGMSLFQANGTINHLPIYGTDQIADVTGAGDAVIAAFTTAHVAGASMFEAARIANVAAALAVMKRGTATVPANELRAALETPA